MKTELIIGRSYRFHSGKVGVLKEMDKRAAYFQVDEPNAYGKINGLVGFFFSTAKTFTLIDEQPEDLHETQKKQILDYLKTGKSITKLEALKMFGCWNSGDVIYKLRNEFKRNNEKFSIETTMITNGKKRFASYKLIENGKEN